MALISIDSKFMKFMSRFVDILGLNVLWLLLCLPVVTVGASTAAAFSVAFRLVDDTEGPLVRDFFRAFRSNFRRATTMWLVHAVAFYALYLDLQILSASPEPSVPLLVATVVSVVFLLLTSLYSYALLARYDSSVKTCLQNSVRLCFQYYGRTGLLLVVLALEAAVFAWNTTMVLMGLLVGPIIMLYTVAGMGKQLFDLVDKSAS